jgi:hypothetical protein
MTTHATETAPIQKTLLVPIPVEKAFALFTSGMDSWWPYESHSIAGEKVETAVLEPREGGRWYERDAEGTEHDWATVTAWDPPTRFVVDWHVSPEVAGSELEVRFAPEGDGTRVELEHRGWERCGAGRRENYSGGWDFVLGKFETAAA